MRQTVFSEFRYLILQKAGVARGRDLLMLIEEIEALRAQNQLLSGEVERLNEMTSDDPVFQ